MPSCKSRQASTKVKGPNSILVPVSLQGLNDVKAWNLRLELLLMRSGLAVHWSCLCSKQGVITFQLNLLSIDKVNVDELWHICETVEPCVIVTMGASPVPESKSVMTTQKTVILCYIQCSDRSIFVKTLAFLIWSIMDKVCLSPLSGQHRMYMDL